MVRWIALATSMYAAAVLDTAAGDALAIGSVAPDWITLVAFTWLVTQPTRAPYLVAGGCGLLGDLISPGPLGFGVVAMLLVVVVATRWQTHFRSLPLRVVGVGLAAAAVAGGVAVGHRILGAAAEAIPALLGDAVGVGFYTAAISLPLFLVLSWWPESAAGWTRVPA